MSELSSKFISLVLIKEIRIWLKKITPADNASNTPNANKGTKGTNRQYDQNQGNRGKQINPNQQGKK
ncbi:hypothetical protein D5E70_13370 [Vibrio parahaemolyticus]|nr:hypothetical protein D5E73_05665 [Vibrio parahaemolyticus]TBT79087.1 hypothetical protein D5E72_05655 [Vibrio parahaemolyticus]TBT79953.1 hypothetical protein D5E70_13370 [Vibrio parahaemolyticus]